MDISDILTSISVPHPRPHTTSSRSTTNLTSNPSHHPRHLDQQALTRAWINERVAPELLPYPSELIARCSKAVEKQIEVLEGMAGDGYSGDRGDDDREGGGPGGKGGVFEMVVLQTELERFRFLMRGFLRARIAKVSFHSFSFSLFFLGCGVWVWWVRGKRGKRRSRRRSRKERS
jgi:GINS complex subunit 4